MACIDIFAPGRALNIPILIEQIWLQIRKRQLLVTEIYDFVLQTSDDQKLSEFLIASPHFCREKRRGTWNDRVVLSHVRAAGWGWFYTQQRLVGDVLTMTVPNSLGPPAHETLDIPGLDDGSNIALLHWVKEIDEEQRVEMMAEIKKSLYKVTLASPLEPLARNQMWFRLIVEPTRLDIPGIRPFLRDNLIEFVVPFYLLTAHISSPTEVRKMTVTQLEQMRALDPLRASVAEELLKIIARDGFDAPGTTTRVEDHRIMLGTYAPLHMSIHGQPVPTLGFFGAQTLHLKLPVDDIHGPDIRTSVGRSLQTVEAEVYNWSGGSVRNPEKDLATVIRTLAHEAATLPPKTKEELATRMTPWRYSEACFLLDRMADQQLISFVDGKCRVCFKLEDEEFTKKLAKLRNLYAQAHRSNDSYSAQALRAFTDCHPFRIDFTVSWISTTWVQRLLIVGGAVTSVLGFILALICFLRG